MKKQKDTGTALIPQEYVESKILLIRDKKVMLDKDLAELYGVETRALNQAVKRNNDRFPEDFMFQLTKTEANLLVSQNVIPSKRSLGGSLPYVFTEHGTLMVAILKPVWFLAFQKTKAWLQLYSGKIVFGFYPKTILR